MTKLPLISPGITVFLMRSSFNDVVQTLSSSFKVRSQNPKSPRFLLKNTISQTKTSSLELESQNLFTMIRFTRPNPILESLSYNLIQRCSAGGTPKGKTKLKTPLKRNKLSTTKKGSGSKPPGSESGDEPAKGKTRISDEKQKLYEQCLNAPCPIRSLTPKEAQREAQREKLGLISKDKQREIETQKKAKGINNTDSEPVRIGTTGLDYVSLGIFKAEELVKYKVTAEDGERLAKENSKVLMRENRERRAAETVLLSLKKAAIEALPERLRVAALEPDLTPFPANRGMATLTPPIEGYLEKVMDAAKKSSSKEKLR
ncbi:unnamed protein product [Eruca vesicaria subsp. sativa]|uniref:Uncharacterized protein n=1 Tax=Eruca vesicaria subsp. sativa TaxID=29727 RepID=A0ABC8LPZ0_ERUVS|nr:unnamed protein product [Eruca vesicaria subsp. sativa]